MLNEMLLDERKNQETIHPLSMDRISAGMNAQNGANMVRIVVLRRNNHRQKADSERIKKIEKTKK